MHRNLAENGIYVMPAVPRLHEMIPPVMLHLVTLTAILREAISTPVLQEPVLLGLLCPKPQSHMHGSRAIACLLLWTQVLRALSQAEPRGAAQSANQSPRQEQTLVKLCGLKTLHQKPVSDVRGFQIVHL